MKNTKSSMIDMKPMNVIKLDIVKLDKSEKYPEKNLLSEDGLYGYLYHTGKQHGDKKDELQTLYRVKIAFCIICKSDLIVLLYARN